MGTSKTEFLKSRGLDVFQPGTLNPERLNLSKYQITPERATRPDQG
jgi:hypothetical protein